MRALVGVGVDQRHVDTVAQRRDRGLAPDGVECGPLGPVDRDELHVGRGLRLHTAQRERGNSNLSHLRFHADLESAQSVRERFAESAFAHAPPRIGFDLHGVEVDEQLALGLKKQ